MYGVKRFDYGTYAEYVRAANAAMKADIESSEVRETISVSDTTFKITAGIYGTYVGIGDNWKRVPDGCDVMSVDIRLWVKNNYPSVYDKSDRADILKLVELIDKVYFDFK